MVRVRKPRDIIDRKDLIRRLDDLVQWSGVSPATHGRVLEIFKDTYRKGWNEVRRRFEEEAVPGEESVREGAHLVDQLVRAIHDFATVHVYRAANPTAVDNIAIVATGGYGRGQLAPFSDIDLMFLLPYRLSPRVEQTIEYILYMLWDCGLKVGHATRSIDEAVRLARGDLTIRTSLLEARWVWGHQDLFETFKSRFAKDVVAGTGRAFVEAKLAERDARHARMGDTRYVLEPNIKEGKGGLRDLQTLFWIAKYLYQTETTAALVKRGVLTDEDARTFAKAENFLWTARCNLHYLANRPEERLTFNVQMEIAARMGYRDHAGSRGVERFMKHYFLIAKDVGDLTRILCAVLEDAQKKPRARFSLSSLGFRKPKIDGFQVEGDRINVADDDAFARDPVMLIRLFREAQRTGLDIHPKALRLVTQNLHLIDRKLRANADANQLFLDMLTSERDVETALTRLNEAGVFGRFIPDFGRVVAQMQYDMYHVYTVDEHTIRALGILNKIECGELKEELPVSTQAIADVQSRRTLYLAVLLHDIAKGRGGDHSEIGAEIALKMGPRFGFSAWETETVSWLVRYHLLMSRTAFKRDLDDPKTVADFVAEVQSPERLKLLIVLTAADIRAVGPNVWNAWKANLLRELYYQAMEALTGGIPAERRAARVDGAKQRAVEKLADWSKREIDAYLASGSPDYWLAFDADTHARHARMVRAAEAEKRTLHVETRVEPERGVSEIVVYAPDHAGLFAAIAGAMAVAGASIVDAKIMTLTTGMALDTFWIQDADGGPFDAPERLKRLKQRIEDTLSGRVSSRRDLEVIRTKGPATRLGVFTVPPRVLIDNNASAAHTVIEINGRDRPGFLRDITQALTSLGLQISSAHISTYGERVVDVFYVRDVFGLKVERESKLNTIRERLFAVIAPDGGAGATAADMPPAGAEAPPSPRPRRRARAAGGR